MATTSTSAANEIAFDREMATLQRAVYDCVVTTLGRFGGSAAVRLALVGDAPGRCALLPLCLFFGHRRTLDMLLPLLIAFLNDASWQLRRAFFDVVVALAPFVGQHAVDAYLLECVLQKLADSDARVAAAAARCLAQLAALGLLKPHRVRAGVTALASRLAPTRPWTLRCAATRALVALCQHLSLADQAHTHIDILIRVRSPTCAFRRRRSCCRP